MLINTRYRKIILLLVAILCTLSVQLQAQNIDVNILKAINPRNPHSDYWSVTSSSAYWLSGGTAIGTLAYGIFKNDKKAQYNAGETFISLGISTVVAEALKVSINRARPADKYPNEIFVSHPEHGQAFPSGHTTLAFATATSLTLEYRKWYVAVPAYLWAGSVGYSRMYQGYHVPSDILGGAAVGVGSAYLSHWLTKKLLAPASKKIIPATVVNQK